MKSIDQLAIVSILIVIVLVNSVICACPQPPSCGVLGCSCTCGKSYQTGTTNWVTNACLNSPSLCQTFMLGCPSGPMFIDVQSGYSCQVPENCVYIGDCPIGSYGCLAGQCHVRPACRTGNDSLEFEQLFRLGLPFNASSIADN